VAWLSAAAAASSAAISASRAEQVIDLVPLAPCHQRLAAEAGIGAQQHPHPGELIPAETLRFVADQVDITPEALAAYAARFQTRYEQLDALRAAFGFVNFAPSHRREILAWLLPVALATTSAAIIAAT
jgi:TnpA family transposase